MDSTILMTNIFKFLKDIVNGFNDYMSDIGPLLLNKIPLGKGNIYYYLQTDIIITTIITLVNDP